MSIGSGRRAVAIGGGTGLPSVLGCLVDLGFETSAVVTMADDGGSSGKLREQLQDWIVDEPSFAKAQPSARFMHCLPVRRGVAVTDRILDGPRSVVIHEAQNRMWGQMAVVYQMMGPGA